MILQSIQQLSQSIYIPRGINTEALDRSLKWDFTPGDFKVHPFPVFTPLTPHLCFCFQIGDHVSGGDIFGRVYENSLVNTHKVMLSPRALGTITHIAEKGSYAVDVIIQLQSLACIASQVFFAGRCFRNRISGKDNKTYHAAAMASPRSTPRDTETHRRLSFVNWAENP